jgi:predicted Zn-dependent protease
MTTSQGAVPRQDACEYLEVLAFTYLQNNRPCKAAALLAAADRLLPLHARALLMLAMAQLRCGEHTLALATLDKITGQGAPDAALYLLRARILAACGRLDESRAAMRDYLVARRALATLPRKQACST